MFTMKRRPPPVVGIFVCFVLTIAVFAPLEPSDADDKTRLRLHGATWEDGVEVLRLKLSGGEKRKRITLVREEASPAQLLLELSPFIGGGVSLDVGLGVPGAAADESSYELGPVELERGMLDLHLALPAPLEEGMEVRGRLAVAPARGGSQHAAQSWPIVLTRPAPINPLWTILPAALALLAGIGASVWSETWLDRRRESHAVMSRITSLRPVWLRAEPPWPPVVRVKALLKQAEDRSREAWIAGTRLIEQRLAQAEALLQLLRRARNVRMGFQGTPMSHHPWLVRFRAHALLRGIMREIGMDACDDQSTGRFHAELAELEKWLLPEQLPEAYVRSVSQSMDQLLCQVRLQGFPDEHKELIAALISLVQKGRDSLSVEEFSWSNTLQTVENFAALKLLWERRDEEEYAALIECRQKNRDVQDYFDVADRAAWRRLRDAAEAGELEIRAPQASGGVVEAFDPILFVVQSGRRALDMTHLLHYELTWDWRIEIERKRPRRWLPSAARDREPRMLTPRSTEPQVIQYAPEPGQLRAAVKITFDRAPRAEREIEVELRSPLQIVPSEAFRRLRLLRGTEGVATWLAIAVGLVVGLQAEYFGNPAFQAGALGDLQAYITLFLWGVGTDKVKSFLAKLPTRQQEDQEG